MRLLSCIAAILVLLGGLGIWFGAPPFRNWMVIEKEMETEMEMEMGNTDPRRLAIFTNTKNGCSDDLPEFIPAPGFCLKGCLSRGSKLRCVLAGLRQIKKVGIATHVLVADNDVFFADWTPRKIFQIFDSFNLPLVVSVERPFYQGPFEGKMNYNFDEGLHVNSGAYMGEIDFMVSAFESMREAQVDFQEGRLPIGKPTGFSSDLYYTQEKSSDQTMLNLYVNENFNQTVAVDWDRLLFFTLVDLIAHKCEPNGGGKNKYRFVPPISEWNEAWCGGAFQKRGKKARVLAWENLRGPTKQFCKIMPPMDDDCKKEWGLDSKCQAFVNGRSHDPYLSAPRSPLVMHAAGAALKPIQKQRRTEWKDRCPGGFQFAYLMDLLEIEENQRRAGLSVNLTSWDLQGGAGG